MLHDFKISGHRGHFHASCTRCVFCTYGKKCVLMKYMLRVLHLWLKVCVHQVHADAAGVWHLGSC